MPKREYVYLLASQRNGTLYVGITNDLIKRVWEYKNDVASCQKIAVMLAAARGACPRSVRQGQFGVDLSARARFARRLELADTQHIHARTLGLVLDHNANVDQPAPLI